MAQRILRFHFDYISPYSYLAWHRLKRFAPGHDLIVEPKPTLFAGLLNEHGHKGPGEIEPKRMYMFKDCIRGAALLGVPFEPPATHPFNPLASLRASLLDMEDDTRSELITRLYSATWAEGLDVGSAEVVAGICTQVGVADAAERIRDPAIKRRLFDAGREAIANGVFGVPAMIVDGELFWGTDSFPHLERFLAGKDPVRPEDTARWAAVKPSAQR
ncbi:MAG: 2-hydroxychromene-2-carboxylate isomerase [Deltaproteobacteria bacterium]|jgi:2-hydroxychromene-2-carboxylate isomerase|nr:2-hydroxychromene-2-carboxylate isomerase [Deltaproteobacteria bacterium]